MCSVCCFLVAVLCALCDARGRLIAVHFATFVVCWVLFVVCCVLYIV